MLSFKMYVILVHIWLAAENTLSDSMLDATINDLLLSIL
jgi:hypothetical protein